ncbi:hypothetical protein PspLS_04100 [Pyricularia sp. CBS 133598]|nr:hypothetical protein PspLS_04100 [Pyricularia sp. CBS 133598]
MGTVLAPAAEPPLNGGHTRKLGRLPVIPPTQVEPPTPLAGKTVLVQGANTALDLGAAVKYASLGASTLMLVWLTFAVLAFAAQIPTISATSVDGVAICFCKGPGAQNGIESKGVQDVTALCCSATHFNGLPNGQTLTGEVIDDGVFGTTEKLCDYRNTDGFKKLASADVIAGFTKCCQATNVGAGKDLVQPTGAYCF